MAEFESCDKCKDHLKDATQFPCNKCIHSATEHFRPMTNADRIRSMSDDELAEFMASIKSGHDLSFGDYINFDNGEFLCSINKPVKYKIHEWLQSEAESVEV